MPEEDTWVEREEPDDSEYGEGDDEAAKEVNPPQERRSERVSKMSEKKAEATGQEYESRLKQTVDKIQSRKNHRQRERAKIAELNKLIDQPDALFQGETTAALAAMHRTDVLQCLHTASDDDLRDVESALAAATTEDIVFEHDPTLKEAMSSAEWPKWQNAIAKEAASLKEMKVYVPVLRSNVPHGRRVLDGKLVLHRKRNDRGEVIRHKARYVVKGYEQIFGKDYSDTTSPTVRMESLRAMLHIAACEGAKRALNRAWTLNDLDISHG